MAKSKWTRARFEEIYDEFLGGADSAKNKRRARILKAATELFMHQGYRKTSVDEIARRADVAKGTVYLHFENKADLLMQAIALEKRLLLDRLAPILDGELPEDQRLRFYVRMLLTVAQELPLVASLMRGENEIMLALEDADPAMLERTQSMGEEWVASLIDDAAPYEFTPEQRRERANVLISLSYFTGQLLDERVRGGRTLEEFADTMTDVVVYGLVHRPPGEEGEDDDEAEEAEE